MRHCPRPQGAVHGIVLAAHGSKIESDGTRVTIECYWDTVNDVRTRELYSSPNGDRWYLCKGTSGNVFVMHQPNASSGGQVSRIEVGEFLTRGRGPEQQNLLRLIGGLVDAAPGEFLTGEGDPGLLLTGGSGHA
jgi:hypothetical protein